MTVTLDEEAYLAHYGILRKSGRYPWGSGETQSARNQSFLDIVADMRKQGMRDTDIAKAFSSDDYPFTTTHLRALTSIAKNAQRQERISMAERLKAKGYSNIKIGERMGIPESSVRALLAPGAKDRADSLVTISKMLKERVDQQNFRDVGTGVENQLGITRTKLDTAIQMLKEEGYDIHYVKVLQQGTGKYTSTKVLVRPDTTYSETYRNRDNIALITDHTTDGGKTFTVIHPPMSIDSKRIGVRYAEQGGANADGVIYVKPGVPDISIGNNHYAQVRIAVDGTHYLKGMAMYKDDMPKDGPDLIFNTNKHDTGNKLDAMKAVKDDPENPFGATIRQIVDPKSGKPISVMNIVGHKPGSGVEGGWDTWKDSLSSQFLSKQSPELARTQLDMAYERKKTEFDGIMALTNPTIRRKLLETFSDNVDSSAVHLQAAALPRQTNRVILPINSLKPNEIYAPSFRNGERVVLIRHPHGGPFEIPELTVNNRNQEAKRLLGNDPRMDAVGIHSKVAERLSGADFDGDTVLVIPNNLGKVRTAPALEGLKNFDPKEEYPPYDGMRTIDGGTYRADTHEVDYGGKKPSSYKQHQMGVVSNLITDMTIRGAKNDEIARAVRHSMVVIDAEKHHLDYKRSAKQNGIQQLKQKYQPNPESRLGYGGASTLISRAGSEQRILERKPRTAPKGGPVEVETGRRMYEPTGAMKYDKRTGTMVPKKMVTTRMAITEDAHTLVSHPGTQIERIYADHANKLKALANTARKEAVATVPLRQSESAKKHYAGEVKSLKAKLNTAYMNRPLERQAQVIAGAKVRAIRQAHPELEGDDLKKIRFRELQSARTKVQAKAIRLDITDREWEAIQAGAISNHMLRQILEKADIDRVKKLATPRSITVMTTVKRRRAEQMIASGYPLSDIADQLGVNLSTLKASLGGE
jgi:biotin operon repressor/DNA-binding CsgD family transcriptional regulator